MQARTKRHLAAAVPFLGLALSAGASLAAAPLDPTGVFLTEDTRARIRVEKCGAKQDQVCGYVVWLKSTTTDDGKPLTDVSNPDPKKRARPSLGVQIILGLKPNEDARWEGKIYNAEDGKNYDITVWLEGQNGVNVRGCLIAFLCKTQTWTRVTDIAPGQLAGPTGGPNGPRPDPEWAVVTTDAGGKDAKKAAVSVRP